MEVRAKARYVRMSPRKVRLVVDVVRGMSVPHAKTQLRFMKKAAAEPVRKLIESAEANATNNHGLDAKTLRIKTIVADGGPIMYRYRPRAMGRVGTIRKRTSHITVVLEGEMAAAPAKKKPTKKAEATTDKKDVKKETKTATKETKPAAKKPATKKSAPASEKKAKSATKK